MTIKAGERLPAGTLMEMNEVAAPGCPAGPANVRVEIEARDKRIVIFGLPGAFTPTCSAKHAPGYVARFEEFRAKGVHEIWCISVNDAFVMGAWARELGSAGRVRMLADGNAEYTRALGLEVDLSGRGMGTRSRRYSMLVEDGFVKALAVEEPGKFEVSGAESMLGRLP